MNAVRHPIAATGLSYLERSELMLGRTHWSRDDYLRAGEAEFDRVFTAKRKVYPGEREHYARVFLDLHCPHAKRRTFGSQANGG